MVVELRDNIAKAIRPWIGDGDEASVGIRKNNDDAAVRAAENVLKSLDYEYMLQWRSDDAYLESRGWINFGYWCDEERVRKSYNRMVEDKSIAHLRIVRRIPASEIEIVIET